MTQPPETVHGPTKMWLIVFSDGEPERYVEVRSPRFTIGRDESCDLVLQDPRVSRQHAYLSSAPGPGRLLHDLGSANGTAIDGKPVPLTPGFRAESERIAEIRGGEWLQFGDSVVLVAREDPSAAVEAHRKGAAGFEAPNEPGT
jgi:pSer/pThr/pTyr-binding forkhead associated (FHA) protein